MCGIVGIVNFDGELVTQDQVRVAADKLRNRGPDDAGTWTDGNVGLGHRRLSILDLSMAGHQPMVSSDGRFVITFNGEIYNFEELRAQLQPPNGGWKSASDTEVLISAYQQWGSSCLQRLRGMFAFAIWDTHKRELFAARDRIGVKPFFYTSIGDKFAFASRPKGIDPLVPTISKQFDSQALRYYLEAGYIPAPYSIFKHIRKLKPGHFLIRNSRSLTIKSYWDFRGIEPDLSMLYRSEDNLVDELEELVNDSVRLRMISDAPVGAFLSGGIDSSLVVALMQKQTSTPIKTYTIGFLESDYDESAHAGKVARFLSTDHQSSVMSVDSLVELLPTFMREFDEPFSDNSSFPTLAVSHLAVQDIKVVLTGDGGDELFGGYHYYSMMRYLAASYSLPNSVRFGLGKLVSSLPSHKTKLLGTALQQRNRAEAFGFVRSIAKDFQSGLAPELLESTLGICELFSLAEEEFPRHLHPTEMAMRLDMLHTLPDDYLQKVDVATMGYSLEARDPLLDHVLIEWSLRLPWQWKLRGGTTKYLLRRLLYRYVPKHLVDRRKMGFGVPAESWLREPLKAWAIERCYDAELFADLPIRQSWVIKLLNLHFSGKRNVFPQLWAVLILLEFVNLNRNNY